MIAAVFQRLDRSARLMAPFTISAFFVMLAALPVQVPGYGQIAFNVSLMAVFYWSIYRPDLMPSVAAFVLGLWQDILIGSPLGLTALVLVLVNWAIVTQRTFFQGKSFAVILFCFSVVTLAATLLSWILVCALDTSLINPMPAVFQAVFTVGAFPFVAWLLARTQHAILRSADVRV